MRCYLAMEFGAKCPRGKGGSWPSDGWEKLGKKRALGINIGGRYHASWSWEAWEGRRRRKENKGRTRSKMGSTSLSSRKSTKEE